MKHHLCIHKDATLFDNEIIPYGKDAIEKHTSAVIHDMLDWILPLIKHPIRDGDVYVCGEGIARRMLGRKLEDRIKKEVVYE